MDNSESVFFICTASVLVALILALGFGNCDANSNLALRKYKICMEHTKDPKLCDQKE